MGEDIWVIYKKISFPIPCAMYMTFIFASERLQEKRYRICHERETKTCKAGFWSPEGPVH